MDGRLLGTIPNVRAESAVVSPFSRSGGRSMVEAVPEDRVKNTDEKIPTQQSHTRGNFGGAAYEQDGHLRRRRATDGVLCQSVAKLRQLGHQHSRSLLPSTLPGCHLAFSSCCFDCSTAITVLWFRRRVTSRTRGGNLNLDGMQCTGIGAADGACTYKRANLTS